MCAWPKPQSTGALVPFVAAKHRPQPVARGQRARQQFDARGFDVGQQRHVLERRVNLVHPQRIGSSFSRNSHRVFTSIQSWNTVSSQMP
jgi:hypothetical protein